MLQDSPSVSSEPGNEHEFEGEREPTLPTFAAYRLLVLCTPSSSGREPAGLDSPSPLDTDGNRD